MQCPAANNAAATLSPWRATVGTPLNVNETDLAFLSDNRRNTEPPRMKYGKICTELPRRNLPRQNQRMVRRQRHTGMAGECECTWKPLGLLVNGISIRRHHAECGPGPD